MDDGQPIIITLVQVKTAANVLTDVYVVPRSNHALIQKIVLSNSAAGGEKVTLALALKGAADAPNQYILNSYSVSGNSLVLLEPQVTLDPSDVIRLKTEGDVVCTILGNLT